MRKLTINLVAGLCLLVILVSASIASVERLAAMGGLDYLIQDEQRDVSFNPAYINRVTGRINIFRRLWISSVSSGTPDNRSEQEVSQHTLRLWMAPGAYKFGLEYWPYSMKVTRVSKGHKYTSKQESSGFCFRVGRSFSKFELGLCYYLQNTKLIWDSQERSTPLSEISLGVLYSVKQNLEIAISGSFESLSSETDGFTEDIWEFRGLVQYDTKWFGTVRFYGGTRSCSLKTGGVERRLNYRRFGIGSKFSVFSSSIAGIGMTYWGSNDNNHYRAYLRAGLETPLSDKLDLRVGTMYRFAHDKWDEQFSDYSGIPTYTMGIGYSLSEKVKDIQLYIQETTHLLS